MKNTCKYRNCPNTACVLWLWRGLMGVFLVLRVVLAGPQMAIAHPEFTPIHLTLWHGVNPPPNRVVLQQLVDQFNHTHPEIQVEPLYIGQPDQQMPKILAAIVGDAPPDMLWFAPIITGRLVELEALRSLDDWLAALPLASDLDPALWDSMQWDGHVWSIPFGTNNVGVFYRPSLLEAAGIHQLPQTWEAFRQVARQLTRPEQKQSGLLLPLGKGEWTVFMWLPFIWSAGGELVDAAPVSEDGELSAEQAPETVHLVTPGAIAALELWHDLVADGSARLSQPERGYELDAFVAGKVAMQLTGPWTLAQLQATGVDFGVMPIPVKTRPATSVGGENLFVFRTTPERERAAQVFAEYVLSEPFQTQWAMQTGYLPVTLRSRQSADYQAFVRDHPAVQTFLQQAPYGRARPIVPEYNRISETLGRAIEATLLGKATPAEALAAAQRRLDRAIGRRHR